MNAKNPNLVSLVRSPSVGFTLDFFSAKDNSLFLNLFHAPITC